MEFKKYNRIDTIDKLVALDQYLMEGDLPKFEYTAVDTETNGIPIYKTTVIGVSISVNSRQGFYIPLLDWIPDTNSRKTKSVNKVKYEIFEHGHLKSPWTGHIYEEFVTPDKVIVPEFIPLILKKWLSKSNLIMHNAPFDINHIWTNFGIDLTDSLFLDTALLSHILNENTPNGLKETAAEWREELGINPYVMANQEQRELGHSVLINGGDVTKGGKANSVWRADPLMMSTYACSDTFLTFGLFEVGLTKFIKQFGEAKLNWLFEEEVMPLCKEVVIPMKRRGVYIDVPFFKNISEQTDKKLLELEDTLMDYIKPHLSGFTLSESIDESVSEKRLIRKIIELEGLIIPTKLDKKSGELRETLGKKEVKAKYEKEPHWVWGYILGEDEIKYSTSKIAEIKNELYIKDKGKRYAFNIGSDPHLRWLFCDKLGFDKQKLPQTDSATKDKPIPSMKADILEEYMLPKYPWVKKLLTFKKLRKLQSTYYLPAVNLNIDGWLYMDMKQNGTVSGRFACSGGFNLQTLPKIDDEMDSISSCSKCQSEDVLVDYVLDSLATVTCSKCNHFEEDIIISSSVKKGFIAPPGYKIINADYNALEPRAFSFVSGDAKLKEVYWKDLDLYSKVYCDVFDDKKLYSPDPSAPNFLKKVYKAGRNFVKPIVLGIPYGASASQVANLTGKFKEITKKDGSRMKIPDAEYGQFVIDKYLGTYPDLAKYMLKQEIECVTKGFVESLCGRRRHFKYAPAIQAFLRLKGLSFEDLVNAPVFQLKDKNVSFDTANGKSFQFSELELRTLMKTLELSWKNCIEGGYWKYVRNLLKADINNAKNVPIQALAGHIANRGMLDTKRLFEVNGIDGWVFLQVHDEISTYVKDEQCELGAKSLRIGMEDNIFAKKIDIRMIADPIICSNLRESK